MPGGGITFVVGIHPRPFSPKSPYIFTVDPDPGPSLQPPISSHFDAFKGDDNSCFLFPVHAIDHVCSQNHRCSKYLYENYNSLNANNRQISNNTGKDFSSRNCH